MVPHRIGNFSGLADLMLPEAQIYSARTRDGMVGYRMRTAAGERTTSSATGYVERGFDAEIRVSGPVAVVSLPYEQPPACRPHPKGPPPGMRAP